VTNRFEEVSMSAIQDTSNASQVEFRKALLADIPALRIVIALSARALSRGDYTESQIEAALRFAWGVDTQLIRDQTYFAGVCKGVIMACGGWSFRKTLFGSDDRKERDPEMLDPAHDGARIRAFFVHPQWARQGLGRQLLALCETEARARGFTKAQLIATLPGERFYGTEGYESEGARDYPMPDGESIQFVPMQKLL
jgi:GNAT superfamily N-acetyltransferase